MTSRIVTQAVLEVLRLDTAAVGLLTTGNDAFGERSWPDAQTGVFAFRHDWSSPLVERLQWRTSVVRLASGREARQALFTLPRTSITYTVGNARQDDALVADWLADHLGRTALWPQPQLAVHLSSPARAGDTALTVAERDVLASWRFAQNVVLTESGFVSTPQAERSALLISSEGWQVVRVFTLTSDVIFLDGCTGRDAHAGSVLMPLAAGVATDAAQLAQWLPGVAKGNVTARLAARSAPDVPPADPYLAGLPVWPDGNWQDDPGHTAEGVISQQDLSFADPWVRRDDPWPASTLRRNYLISGQQDITAWLARLWSAAGRLDAFWLPDASAPVLTVAANAAIGDGHLRTSHASAAAWWHRPAACRILTQDGASHYVRSSTFQADRGEGVLVLGTALGAAVPAGSRIIRLSCCRLDHDVVELHWHAPSLLEIPITARQLALPPAF